MNELCGWELQDRIAHGRGRNRNEYEGMQKERSRAAVTATLTRRGAMLPATHATGDRPYTRAMRHCVVTSPEERLQGWREMDRLAREAEAAAARFGAGAQVDEAEWQQFRAAYLRKKADRELAAILRAVPME